MRKTVKHGVVAVIALLVGLCAASVVYGGVDYGGFENVEYTGQSMDDGRPIYTGNTSDGESHTLTTQPVTGTGTQDPAAGGAGSSETWTSGSSESRWNLQTSEAVSSGSTPTPGSSGSRTVSTGPTIVKSEVSVTGDTHYTTYSDDTEVITTRHDDGTYYESVIYPDGTKVSKTSGVEFGTEGSSSDSSYEDWIRSIGGSKGSDGSSDSTDGTRGTGGTSGTDGSGGKDGHWETGLEWIRDEDTAKRSVVTEVRVNPDGSQVQKGYRENPDGTRTEFTTTIPSGHLEATSEWVPGADGADGESGGKGTDGTGGTSTGKSGSDGTPATVTIGTDGKVTVTPGADVWGEITTTTTTPGEETTITTAKGTDDLYYLINHDKSTVTKETKDDGSTEYVVTTEDGETHTFNFGSDGGEKSWYTVVKDKDGNDKLLKHTVRETVSEETEWTDLGYEWAVQNFTDDSSPYYGRSVTRTLPIPHESKGGTDKGGLLSYGEGVFQETFVHYGEHEMTVTHYFNIDVYSKHETESCDSNDDGTESCDTEIEYIYEYSYIHKDPPQFYKFHVPLICLDCVPPAPGVKVCIGGGCDCVGNEYIVCDIDHSTEKDLQIENRVELER